MAVLLGLFVVGRAPAGLTGAGPGPALLPPAAAPAAVTADLEGAGWGDTWLRCLPAWPQAEVVVEVAVLLKPLRKVGGMAKTATTAAITPKQTRRRDDCKRGGIEKGIGNFTYDKRACDAYMGPR